MREVKYKAWDNVANKMYCVGGEELIVFIMKDGYIQAEQIIPDDSEDGYRVEYLEHLKYLEYTGLKDKNGVKIFEGDILKCLCNKRSWTTFPEPPELFTKNMVIEWWQSHSSIGYRVRDGKGKTMMVKPSSLSTMEVEIVGNVFENPEFLT